MPVAHILTRKGDDPIAADGMMHHDWIFDVLEDLRAFAAENGLPATAAQVEEVVRVARVELRATGGPLGRVPPSGRRN